MQGLPDPWTHSKGAPAAYLHPLVKPWPFRGWAVDLIGKIYPPSSKQHTFILVAIDYFTKWAEAIPLKNVNQEVVIKVLKENIILWFGIPQTITADQGSVFTGDQVKEFANLKFFSRVRSACKRGEWIQTDSKSGLDEVSKSTNPK
ncbi:hypothetical protein VitviT2T_015852 [Vitis vinifera]|uniref:Integrase catalytic domain-containing protein n=1 Tax=Vitis vinifera TaxID=29760 RepID=A0ABY9CPT7_VITVI|nr:hypothetical protein VitviT2T_015852 [Vitis vinifera]